MWGPPPPFSFLSTLKTWEEDQSAPSSQQSGPGPQDGEEPGPSGPGTAPGAPGVPGARGGRLMLPGGGVPAAHSTRVPPLCAEPGPKQPRCLQRGERGLDPATGAAAFLEPAARECARRNLSFLECWWIHALICLTSNQATAPTSGLLGKGCFKTADQAEKPGLGEGRLCRKRGLGQRLIFHGVPAGGVGRAEGGRPFSPRMPAG